METVKLFFGWPGGAVWGNLLASALTVMPGLVWHHRKLKAHIDQAVGSAVAEKQEAGR